MRIFLRPDKLTFETWNAIPDIYINMKNIHLESCQSSPALSGVSVTPEVMTSGISNSDFAINDTVTTGEDVSWEINAVHLTCSCATTRESGMKRQCSAASPKALVDSGVSKLHVRTIAAPLCSLERVQSRHKGDATVTSERLP